MGMGLVSLPELQRFPVLLSVHMIISLLLRKEFVWIFCNTHRC